MAVRIGRSSVSFDLVNLNYGEPTQICFIKVLPDEDQGFDIVGIDNDMRQYFFGEEASTRWNLHELTSTLRNFTNEAVDIRDFEALKGSFCRYSHEITLVVHTAAQPSHDWAAREPFTDFTVNANGTLNLLEATRQFCPDAVFIFTSTNKVYGDTPNRLPLVELPT